MTRPREDVVEGGGDPLGVEEGVGHALGGDRVLRVAGVADEHPPGAVGLAEEVRDGGRGEPLDPCCAADPLGERRGELEGHEEVGLGVGLEGVGLGGRPADDDEGESVVGREGAPAAVGADVDLEAVDRQVAEVRVEALLEDGLGQVLLGLHGAGDPRGSAVGADHDGCPLGDGDAVGAVAADAAHDAVLDDAPRRRRSPRGPRRRLARRRRRGSCRARSGGVRSRWSCRRPAGSSR